MIDSTFFWKKSKWGGSMRGAFHYRRVPVSFRMILMVIAFPKSPPDMSDNWLVGQQGQLQARDFSLQKEKWPTIFIPMAAKLLGFLANFFVRNSPSSTFLCAFTLIHLDSFTFTKKNIPWRLRCKAFGKTRRKWFNLCPDKPIKCASETGKFLIHFKDYCFSLHWC